MATKGFRTRAWRGSNLAVSALLFALVSLAACGSGSQNAAVSTSGSGNGTPPAAALHGRVDGGGPQNPISGSTVTLFAMGPAGASGGTCTGASCYGSGSLQLAQTTSDSSGSFSFSSTPYTCPSGDTGDQTYLVVTAGNPGSGANPAIGLMALTGPCNQLSNSTFVVANELTTAAAEWALAQFTGADGQTVGTSSANTTGLANAANEVMSDLVKSVGTDTTDSGIPASLMPWSSSSSSCTSTTATSNCDGLERIDTLANILAACVNSSGPSSVPCTNLYDDTGGSGSPPSAWTTLAAAHAVVTDPTANVSAIYGLQTDSTVAPFQPELASAPADWTLALNFQPLGAQFNSPNFLAIDSTGNIWIVNSSGGSGCSSTLPVAPCGSVSELSAASGYATGANFAPSGADFALPDALTVDVAGNVWAANLLGGSGCSANVTPCGSVSELTAASNYATGVNFAPSGAQFDVVGTVALDAHGNVWATNEEGGTGCANNLAPCGSISELTASSNYVTGANFAPSGAEFSDPLDIAVDASGDVWAADENNISTTSTNFIGGVSELTSSSNYTTGLGFDPSGAAIALPDILALDNANNAWLSNLSGGSGCSSTDPNSTVPPCGSISELTASSGYGTGLNLAPSGAVFDRAEGIAFDASGNIWAANRYGGSGCSSSTAPCGSLAELTAASTYTTGINFAPEGAGFDLTGFVAIDSTGNIWIVNITGGSGCSSSSQVAPCGSVSEFIGLAKPVLTPSQACLVKGKNVCLP